KNVARVFVLQFDCAEGERAAIPSRRPISALHPSQLFGYIRTLTGRGEAPLQAAILDAPGAGGSVRPASTNQIEENGHHEYFVVDRWLRGAPHRILHLGDPIGDVRG